MSVEIQPLDMSIYQEAGINPAATHGLLSDAHAPVSETGKINIDFDFSAQIDALSPVGKAQLYYQTIDDIHDEVREMKSTILRESGYNSSGARKRMIADVREHLAEITAGTYAVKDERRDATAALKIEVDDLGNIVFDAGDRQSDFEINISESDKFALGLKYQLLGELNESIEKDPEAQKAKIEFGLAKYAVYKAAGEIGGFNRRKGHMSDAIASLQRSASHQGRQLTAHETLAVRTLQNNLDALVTASSGIKITEAVRGELARRGSIKNANQLKKGLLETENMTQIIGRVVPSLKAGRPLLLMGETGGAKTALAKHLARKYLGREPYLVDGSPDTNVYNMIGKPGLRPTGSGGTESYYEAGPMLRAMVEGCPVVVNEYDNIRDMIGLFNGILELQPGDTYLPPGATEPIYIRPGFVVIATANMRSKRYEREKIDPSTMQRFRRGAGIEKVHYPDHTLTPALENPEQNKKLATIALIDERGRLKIPPGIDNIKFNALLDAAHITQRLFTDPSVVGTPSVGNMVQDSQIVARARQGEPVLKEAVLAPREVLGILESLKAADGANTIERALANFIVSQTVPSDRQILSVILASRKLLDGITESELEIPTGTLANFGNRP